MSFVPSTTPDITESIPASLSSRIAGVAKASRRAKFDIEIGGLKFAIAPDQSNPYIRQSVSVQKQQQDNSKEPGEQTLDGYWIRSQNSWHRGAGVNYYEPGVETDSEYRFYESSGVNVWKKGEISLLRSMTLAQSVTGDCYVQDAGGGSFAITDANSVVSWIGPTLTLNTPPAGYNGRWYFFGTSKYVKVGYTSPASATIGVWNGATSTVIANNATVEPKVRYLKDRLMVTHGSRVYEVPLSASPAVDLSSTTAALYNPVDTATTWVDMVDGPSSIYAAWDDGRRGGIVTFTLKEATSGSTPTLSQPFRVLDLPVGERITRMFSYLGRFLVLSTTAGIRVCAIDANGTLTMGQVSIPARAGTFTSFHADGSFVYVGGAYVPAYGTSGGTTVPGWTTTTGFARLNLGQPVGEAADLTFAWAFDIRSTASGSVTSSVRIDEDTQAIAISGSGVWKTSGTYEAGGYLAMGRVRYNTFVQKVYRSLDIDASLNGGGLQALLYDESENARFSLSMDSSTGLFDEVSLPLDALRRFVRPVFILSAGTSTTPSLNQFQLRAVPTPPRVRQVRYPLRCQDHEEDRNGVAYGRLGYAWDRLSALEALEESRLPQTVIDRRTGETFTATIDDIRFIGTTAPDKGQKNWGGFIVVTLTKLT